jgi:hypothetical protein
MPKKDDIVTELNWTSEKISSLVWSLNVGTLGTTWSLLIAQRFSIRNAIWIFVPCLLSLLCEMGQYVSGYWLALRIEEDIRRNNRKEYEYPTDSLLYKTRKGLLWWKMGFAIVAAVILGFTLFQKFT